MAHVPDRGPFKSQGRCFTIAATETTMTFQVGLLRRPLVSMNTRTYSFTRK